MADERFNVRLGLEFVPGQAVAQANAEAEKVRAIFRRINEGTATGGVLDPSQAIRFGQELSRAIRAALDQRLSPGISNISAARDFKSELTRTARDPNTSAAEKAQIAALQRDINAVLKLEQSHREAAEAERRYAAEVEAAAARARQRSLTQGPALQQGLSPLARAAVEGTRRTTPTAGYAERLSIAAAELRKQAQTAETAERRKLLTALAAEIQSTVAIERSNRALTTVEENVTRTLERRRAAEEARQRNQNEADAAFGQQVSYPNARQAATPRLRSAQEAVNVAERRLQSATEALAAERISETRTADSARAAQNRLTQAQVGLAAAQERVALETARSQAGPTGLRAQFGQGFRGASERPFAEQIGQAFKFSIFYGAAYRALSGITQVFQQTLTEGIAFQNEVTELKLATGRTQESAEELANLVGKQATQYGFAASQGVQIAAKAQGFYGTTGADPAVQEAVARVSANVVNQVAFASGKQPDDIQANLAAITQAYGLGAQSQTYIGDLDAYFSRKFGADPGSTIGAISQSGTVGKAAGFSPAEVGAIAADIMARTGATESAAGGYLAQIFSRAGEGSLTKLAARYDIDPSATLAEQMKELARVYKERPDQRDEISAVAGRGKVQNAFIALLQDYDVVQSTARDATKEAGGSLADATAERMKNIGGEIQQTVGALRLFATELGETGVLDILGAAVVTLRELVEAGTTLLEAFNTLPRGVRDAILALGLLTAALRLTALSQGAGGLLARAGIFRSAGLLTPGAAGAIIPAGTRAVATSAGAVPLASRAGLAAGATGVASAGASALGVLASPAVLAVGGLLAIAALKGTSDKLKEAQSAATEVLNDDTTGIGSTPEEYLARAAALTAQQKALEEASGGLKAGILGTARQDQTAELLKQEAARLTALAATKQALDAEATSGQRTTISGFDAESLTSSLDLIATSGGSAQQQMDALAAAIAGGGQAAQNAAAAFDAKTTGDELAGGTLKALRDATPTTSAPGAGRVRASQLDDIINANLSGTDVAKLLGQGFEGLDSLNDLGQEKAQQIATSIVDEAFGKLEADTKKSTEGQSNQAQILGELQKQKEAYASAVATYLLGQAESTKELVEAGTVLSSAELTASIDKFIAGGQEILSGLVDTDYSGRVAATRQVVQNIQLAISKTPNGAGAGDEVKLAAARRAFAEAQFNRFEALRKAQMQSARTDAEANQIGRTFLRREINAAVASGDQDLLAKIIAQAGEGSIRLARRAIENALKVAEAADEAQRKQNALGAQTGNKFSSEIGGPTAGGAVTPFKSQAAPLRKLLASLDTATYAEGGGNVYRNNDGESAAQQAAARAAAEAARRQDDVAAARATLAGAQATLDEAKEGSVAYYNALGSVYSAQQALAETIGNQQVSQRQAAAIRSQGAIAGARASIFAAKVAMDQAGKGTAEYYNALGQFYQAQQALSDAIIAYRQNLFLLGRDITDPLVQARAAARAAAQKLRADRAAGASPETIAADRVALQQAQANRESTAFSQRLSAMQTADDLGRISHQKYLSYLQHEHDRLEGIKNRTYQQQQQLDQIDQLMKSAASAMDAQFNFGDINLPTPYQVRRLITQQAGQVKESARTAAGINTTATRRETGNTYNFSIDGADTAKVEKIIRSVVGGGSTLNVRTHSARRGR